MIPWQFDGAAILSQLQCAGMTSVLKLMQNGFPSRTSFGSLYSSYQAKLPPKLARMDPRLFAKCLFRALGLDQHDFQFGLTRVFFRAGKFSEFDQMMKQDPESMSSLIVKVNEWLVKARFRQAQYAVWSVIKLKNKIAYRIAQVTRLQSAARGHLARQRFSKQIVVYRKACALLKSSKEIKKILLRLNEASRVKYTSSAHSTIRDLEKLVAHVKLAKPEQLEKAENAYEHYVKRVSTMIADLKRQQKNDELEELERKRKEAEEKERQEAERKRREEEEKENQRRLEEQKQRDQKAHEAQLAEQIRKAAVEKEEAEKREQQERLDVMVSNRLADADGVALMPVPSAPPDSASSSMRLRRGHFDLTHWTYAELRDAINNSMVMQLLGPNIGDLKKRSPVKRLSPTTVARIMIQGIAALRDVHTLGYIHRDVKPANMCFGITQNTRHVLKLVDYGMVRRFKNPDGTRRKARNKPGFRGTLRYSSIRVHDGKEQVPADDLVSMAYSGAELLLVNLPWKLVCTEDIKQAKIDFQVPNSPFLLLTGPFFSVFCGAVFSLRSTDEPDHSSLQALLTDMTGGKSLREAYDWEENYRDTFGSSTTESV
uniref:non-specific serine/threonine protein kinase n=2 Tax=Caenorhabditis tropicalis TaxID=1561998 RepID=A0A1I7U3U4_9PELO